MHTARPGIKHNTGACECHTECMLLMAFEYVAPNLQLHKSLFKVIIWLRHFDTYLYSFYTIQITWLCVWPTQIVVNKLWWIHIYSLNLPQRLFSKLFTTWYILYRDRQMMRMESLLMAAMCCWLTTLLVSHQPSVRYLNYWRGRRTSISTQTLPLRYWMRLRWSYQLHTVVCKSSIAWNFIMSAICGHF